MKVILTKDVKGRGKKGDIIEVKDGYAKNFLFNKGYAVKETEHSIRKLEVEKEEEQEKELIVRKKYEKLRDSLSELELIFKVKVGEKNKVFGSISSKQILTKLKEKGFDIDKKKIIMPDSVSSLGKHIIKIELYKDIIQELKIELKKE